MIRKVCILLVALIAAMIILKLALLSGGKGTEVKSAPSVTRAEDAKSDLAPTVYYTRWVPYAVENDVTHRNGYILDLVRAIFPKARFVRVFQDMHEVERAIERDPDGVSVMYGDHPVFAAYEKAPTPLHEIDMVVYTLRTNDWRYASTLDSLAQLRLGFTEDYLDVKILRTLLEKHPDRVRVYHAGETNFDNIAAEVLAGRIDAFAVSLGNAADSRQVGMAAERMLDFRQSKPIGKGDPLFIPSNRDPARAKRLIEDYERGLRLVERTGELRRLREYYGMP